MKLSTKILLVIFSGFIVNILLTSMLIFYFIDNTPLNLSSELTLELTDRFVFWLITAIIVTSIFITCLIWIIVYKMSVKPLIDFNRITKIIASGNLGQRINYHSNDEIGELSDNLNKIIQNLVGAFQGMANSYRTTKQKELDLALNVEALAESKAKDEALLSSIGEGVIAIDGAGKIIFVNKEAANMLGWTIEEMRGNIWKEFLKVYDIRSQKEITEDEQTIAKAASLEVRLSDRYFLSKKDKTLFASSITVSPVITSGHVNGVILVVRDITKEHEIDRMKTEFISIASHQLRTPLSAIRWFSELILDETAGKLNQEQLELTKNIALSTERMIELVNSLLNISRIESGRIIIDSKPTDLVLLVKEIINELQVKIREKEQQLIISTHENLPKIHIDPKLIRQVYLNLLTNAIKYTPKKGEISVFISKRDDQVISQVSDTGFGIPLDEQPKLFNKFFRAKNIAKVETDGNGLGLYLVKAIIESSKGKIWFKSEEGKGTTFWFSLPLAGIPSKEGEVSLDN